jgi:hypothetical protein
MKTSLIVCLALVLVGCGTSPKKASLTAEQATKIAMQALPPPPTNSAYSVSLAGGYWQVVVIPVSTKDGRVDFSSATNVLHSVATVRDSDGKVEVIR